MLQLCLTRPPPRVGGAGDGGAGHATAITAGELDRLGLLLRGPAEAAAAGTTSDPDGSPMDVSPTPFQGAPAASLYPGAAARCGLFAGGTSVAVVLLQADCHAGLHGGAASALPAGRPRSRGRVAWGAHASGHVLARALPQGLAAAHLRRERGLGSASVTPRH